MVIATLLAAASPAAAQEKNSVAVGVNVTTRVAPDEEAHGRSGIGFKFRLGHSKTGWGWHYGFSWYGAELDREVGGRATHLGRLKVRPLLGGYGYTRTLTNRLAVSGKVLGGFAFTSFSLAEEASNAYSAIAIRDLRVETGMTPIVKPELSLWYDLNGRFGISADVGYIFARPKITVSHSVGTIVGRVRADAFSFSTGLVVRVF